MEQKYKDSKFGRWIVLKEPEMIGKRKYVFCSCECGIQKLVLLQSLIKNKSKGCINCHNKDNGKTLFDDLTGRVFGKWQVIKRIENTKNNKATQYLCLCTICNKKSRVKRDSLTSGRSTNCGRCNAYEGLSGMIWNLIVCGARRRNIEIKITSKYIWDLFIEQQGKCIYTDRKIFLKKGHSDRASLDRIDSTKGYLEGNVQWVHKDVNRMKCEYSHEYFINTCRLIGLKYK